MSVRLRPLQQSDWVEVSRIYQAGIETGKATFETSVPEWPVWDAKFSKQCRLVAPNAIALAGWAALSPVSSRCAYAGVAEVSVYVDPDHQGRGVGTRLLQGLIDCSEKHEIWTLQAEMFAENSASIALHKKCGFRAVGVHERLGQLNGIWKNVVLMERRSSVVGRP